MEGFTEILDKIDEIKRLIREEGRIIDEIENAIWKTDQGKV